MNSYPQDEKGWLRSVPEAESPGCDATAGYVQSVVVPQIMSDHDTTLRELVEMRAAAEALAEALRMMTIRLESIPELPKGMVYDMTRAALAQWEEAKK